MACKCLDSTSKLTIRERSQLVEQWLNHCWVQENHQYLKCEAVVVYVRSHELLLVRHAHETKKPRNEVVAGPIKDCKEHP